MHLANFAHSTFFVRGSIYIQLPNCKKHCEQNFLKFIQRFDCWTE